MHPEKCTSPHTQTRPFRRFRTPKSRYSE